MKKYLVAIFMLTASFSTFAQLGTFVSLLAGGSGYGAKQILSSYIKGQQYVLAGQQLMITALGIKTEEAKLILEAAALTENPTKSDIEESKIVMESGSVLLKEAMKDHAGKMSDASKKEFSKGVAALALGVREYVTMSASVANFKPSIFEVSDTFTAATTIVPSLPSSIGNLLTTLKTATTFMQDNKMPPLEENATAGLPGF